MTSWFKTWRNYICWIDVLKVPSSHNLYMSWHDRAVYLSARVEFYTEHMRDLYFRESAPEIYFPALDSQKQGKGCHMSSLQNNIWNLPDQSTILPKLIYDKEGKLAGPIQILLVRVHSPALILKTARTTLPLLKLLEAVNLKTFNASKVQMPWWW